MTLVLLCVSSNSREQAVTLLHLECYHERAHGEMKTRLKSLSDWLNWAHDPSRKQTRMPGRGSRDNKSRNKMAASTQNCLAA